MTPAPQIDLTPEVLTEMRSNVERDVERRSIVTLALRPETVLALLSELESSRRQIERLYDERQKVDQALARLSGERKTMELRILALEDETTRWFTESERRGSDLAAIRQDRDRLAEALREIGDGYYLPADAPKRLDECVDLARSVISKETA